MWLGSMCACCQCTVVVVRTSHDVCMYLFVLYKVGTCSLMAIPTIVLLSSTVHSHVHFESLYVQYVHTVHTYRANMIIIRVD